MEFFLEAALFVLGGHDGVMATINRLKYVLGMIRGIWDVPKMMQIIL